jgi:NAD+ synthase (glutamine-hydrolysing)
MKIGLAQMRVVPGRPETNVRTMRRFIDQAVGEGCALIAFPEMCVGGYLLGDLWLDDSFCADLMSYNEALRDLSGPIGIIYGNVFVDAGRKNKDGRTRKFNAAYAWAGGKPVPRTRPNGLAEGIAAKTLLPNYRIFDDERYFYSLRDESADRGAPLEELLVPFDFVSRAGERLRIGVEVCEDLWFNDYAYRSRPLNVSRMLIDNGAEAIVNISSSPWTFGKDGARDRRIQDARHDCRSFVPFYYVNCVGVQNNGKNFVTFDGDSTVYNEAAQPVQEAVVPYREELLVHTHVADEAAGRTRRRTQSREEAQLAAAVEAMKSLDDIMGDAFPWIVGLSGGVDSAVVAGLAVLAAGRERVRLFTLPSMFSSAATRGTAEHVAARLGLTLDVLPIDPLVSANTLLLESFSPGELHRENIQAKVRGTSVLSNLAGILGGVMTNNGNKVEIALGYATLYGDVNGALAPIGDLLKTEVFALARHLNDTVFGEEMIPRVLLPDADFRFGLPPTAELKPDQIDPMKWGYHDALVRVFTEYRRQNPETVLRWYAEGSLADNLGIAPGLLARYGLDDPADFVADLEWVAASLSRAVFKRIQAPPIVIMSRGSFGFDIRESQLPVAHTRAYLALRKNLIGR